MTFSRLFLFTKSFSEHLLLLFFDNFQTLQIFCYIFNVDVIKRYCNEKHYWWFKTAEAYYVSCNYSAYAYGFFILSHICSVLRTLWHFDCFFWENASLRNSSTYSLRPFLSKSLPLLAILLIILLISDTYAGYFPRYYYPD